MNGLELVEQPGRIDVGAAGDDLEPARDVRLSDPFVLVGQQDLAHSRRVQRQPATNPRRTRHPLGAVDAVDVERLVALANREVSSLLGQREEVLEVRPRGLTQLAPGVLGDLPEAKADDVPTPVVSVEGAPLHQLGSEAVRRGKGHVGGRGEVAQRQVAWAAFERRQHREDLRGDGAAITPHRSSSSSVPLGPTRVRLAGATRPSRPGPPARAPSYARRR